MTDTDPSAQDAAVAAFWADARIRAKLNRIEVYSGQSVADTLPPPAWSFGDDPQTADRLLALVLEGRKTATASALRDYEEEARERARADRDAGDHPAPGDVLVDTDLDLALPQRGLLSILLDGRGRPRALIQTTGVEVVRLGDVTAEHARREGEDGGSLEQWRRTHGEFFARTSPDPVDDDTMVVLERFQVLVPADARRAARRHGLG